jgi:hypothetical protein
VAGEVALEAADGFAGGLAFGLAAGDVVLGCGVAAGAGDDDAVKRGVDLAVAALVEALSLGVAGAGGDGRDAGGAASSAGVAKRCAGDPPTSLAAVSGPNPGWESSCGAIVVTSWAISRSSALMACESSRIRGSSSRGDADAHGLLSARQAPGDAWCPTAVEQRAARQLELGPEIVQMPLQRAVERDALANESFAVIDQQPQIQLGPIQMRDREGLHAFLQRGAGDTQCVDRIGLAALPGALASDGRQVRRDPQHPLAASDQKPLE